MKVHPELKKLLGKMTEVERAILFTVVETRFCFYLDSRRIKRAAISGNGKHLKNTEAIEVLNGLSKKHHSFYDIVSGALTTPGNA